MENPTKISLQHTYRDLYAHALNTLITNLQRLRITPDLPYDKKMEAVLISEEQLVLMKRAVIFLKNTEAIPYVMPQLPKKD